MPLISIITPVFNVENYLEEFIDSLRKQSFDDWELILIDDGSTDTSSKKCDLFAELDSRVRVFHQKNQGVSNARNKGLSYANGKYVLFADSDDKFETESITNLTKLIRKANSNVIFLPYNEFIEGKQYSKISTFQKFVNSQSIEIFFEKLVSHNIQIPWSTFQLVYNRKFLNSNNISFDNNYIGAEDLKILLEVLKCNPSFAIFPNPVINYRLKKVYSLNNTINYKSVINRLRTFNEASNFFNQNKKLFEYFNQNFANIIIQINKIADSDKQDRCFEYVNNHKRLLSNLGSVLKYRIANRVWKILGIKRGTKLLGVLKNEL